MHRGESFGIENFFTGESRRISARSTSFCNILVLKRDDFIDRCKKYPLDYEIFCHYRDYMKLYPNFEFKAKYCECCKEKTHFIDQCLTLHLKKDFNKIKIILGKSKVEERDPSFKRNKLREK